MNRDFVEILSELSAAGAEFIVVGAHALAALGIPRATGDIDIWVQQSLAIDPDYRFSRVRALWNALRSILKV